MSEVIINGVDLTPPKLDTLRPGLESLVYLLRNPHMLFGWPSERRTDCRCYIDWDRVPERLNRILERSAPSNPNSICADCVWNIRLAAWLLRENGISICKGPMGVRFWDDECGDPHVSLELNIDAPPSRAGELNLEHGQFAVTQRYPIAGLYLEFVSPRPREGELQPQTTEGAPPCRFVQEI